MRVELEHPHQPEIMSLIEELDAYQKALYPPEACYALDLTALEQENVIFAVVRNDAGAAIACGALVLGGKTAELKRMFVSPSGRGQGAAAKVLTKLEDEAIKHDYRLVQLETGPFQLEALAFYKKHGFQVCDAFGDYPEHPLSVFMEKRLGGG
jgi:putative acetyltransferase